MPERDAAVRYDREPLAERPQHGREWLGIVNASQSFSVAIWWPTREDWQTLKSVPHVMVNGELLKLHEARQLYNLLGFAVERMGDAVETNTLPWEEAGSHAG